MGFLCLVVVDAAQLVIPQLVKEAINLVSAGRFDLHDILRLSTWMVCIAVAISSGRFLWRYFIHGSSRRIETEMRDELFDHLLGLSGTFYQQNKTGDIMARATNDMGAIRQATGMGLVTLVDGSFMAIAILAIMLVQNPSTTLLTIIPLPIITVLIVFFGSLVGKRFERVQAIYSRLSEIAQETMSGIRVVKAFVKEEKFASDFSVVNDDYRSASMSLVGIFGFFFPLISFLSGVTTFILLLVGGNAVLRNRMSAGDIVAMLSYLQMLVWPMIGAGFTVNTFQRGAASLKRGERGPSCGSGHRVPPRRHPCRSRRLRRVPLAVLLVYAGREGSPRGYRFLDRGGQDPWHPRQGGLRQIDTPPPPAAAHRSARGYRLHRRPRCP